MRVVGPHRKLYYQEYWKKNKKSMLLQRKGYRKKRRKKVLTFFGGKCAHCGYKDWRALQIDHINGGGCREKKRMGGESIFYTYIYNLILSDPRRVKAKYQLLCSNCNWIKRYENDENAKFSMSKGKIQLIG